MGRISWRAGTGNSEVDRGNILELKIFLCKFDSLFKNRLNGMA